MKVQWIQSPHFDDRIGFDKPTMIVMHYTGMKTQAEAIHRLTDPASRVSAHFVILEEGSLLQLVPEHLRAWHAGKSFWRGCRDVNSASIGIEICNPGHEHGYVDFTPHQMETLIQLSKKLIAQYDICPWNIVGHSDVAPLRKDDPGERFNWEALGGHGIGFWPHPRQRLDGSTATLTQLLETIGYDPLAIAQKPDAVITAFCRHFLPEHFLSPASENHMLLKAQSLVDGLVEAIAHSL
jgi:N-acetylmuramoyl-L-alanine amidase